MLDFTNTPERRKKAAQARTRKFFYSIGLVVLLPVATNALGII